MSLAREGWRECGAEEAPRYSGVIPLEDPVGEVPTSTECLPLDAQWTALA